MLILNVLVHFTVIFTLFGQFEIMLAELYKVFINFSLLKLFQSKFVITILSSQVISNVFTGTEIYMVFHRFGHMQSQ